MKYLISFLILFTMATTANNFLNDPNIIINEKNNTIDRINAKKGTIDITNASNPVVTYCQNNGGTYVADRNVCSLPNNVNYDAWDYWGNGYDNWTYNDWDFYNTYFGF